MTTEQEKAAKEWAARYHIMGSEIATASYVAGWNYALANAMPMPADELIHIARQNERDAIEKKLLAMAGAAFIAGRDDHAHWFRSLVNVLFKNPGDTSA